MEYQRKALLYAEKHGIVEYEIKNNKMHYMEEFTSSRYKVIVNLDTMLEIRKEVKHKDLKITRLYC